MRRFLLSSLGVVGVLVFSGGAAMADGGPYGMPSQETLKEKLSLKEEQGTKVKAIYEKYAEKQSSAGKSGGSNLKSEMISEIKALLDEGQVNKLVELCGGDAPPKGEGKRAGGDAPPKGSKGQ